MFIWLLALVTLPCLVLMIIAIFYLIAGIRTTIIGSREDSRVKKVSGINAIFISLLAVVAVYFLWAILCRTFLSWEL